MDYIGRLAKQITAARLQSSKPQSQAQKGYIDGSMVSINGKRYPYEMVTDMTPVDGLPVWCQLAADGKAIVVGG